MGKIAVNCRKKAHKLWHAFSISHELCRNCIKYNISDNYGVIFEVSDILVKVMSLNYYKIKTDVFAFKKSITVSVYTKFKCKE